jgi:hypothetical protein
LKKADLKKPVISFKDGSKFILRILRFTSSLSSIHISIFTDC